jgi:hypothetical protein
MRTTFVMDPPPIVEDWLAQRRALGQDLYDEYRVTTLRAALRLVAPGALPAPTRPRPGLPRTRTAAYRRNSRQAGSSVASVNS